MGASLGDAIKQVPKLEMAYENEHAVRDLFEYALKLEGVCRQVGTHAAGVVIGKGPLEEVTPLYKDPRTGIVATQYSMKPVEKVGLIKFDFLGLKTLTLIKNAVDIIRETRGTDLDIDQVSMEDTDTYRLLSRGDTAGVFQLESSGMQKLIKQLAPTTFNELIALVALYRPGPLKSGMVDEYINRKHGRAPMTLMDERMGPILESTYGVIVYQEQVIQIASAIAGFSAGEADILRRAIGKKDSAEMQRMKARFLSGSVENGMQQETAQRLFHEIETFSEYGFNRSHAASYAAIAFQTAYLKAHYPVEFMAALLTSEKDNADKLVKYLRMCRTRDIVVGPPDVNESQTSFTVVNHRIRFGLKRIEEHWRRRGSGPCWKRRTAGGAFVSLFDFCARVDLRKINRKVLESLIKAGAFDGFGTAHRGTLLRSLDSAMQTRQSQAERTPARSRSRCSEACLTALQTAQHRNQVSKRELRHYRWTSCLCTRKRSIGCFFSAHPLDKFTDILPSNVIGSTDLWENRSQKRRWPSRA